MIVNMLQLNMEWVRIPLSPPVFTIKTAHFYFCVYRAFAALCCSKVVARDFFISGFAIFSFSQTIFQLFCIMGLTFVAK